MKLEPYLFDALMRDLVGHSKAPAAYLVYLQLYRHTEGFGRDSVAMSLMMLADATGLSKRSVQTAVALLQSRELISIHKQRPTSIPIYTVRTPWRRVTQTRDQQS
jgi:hypothetical protein